MTDKERFAIKRFMSLCFTFSRFDGMLYEDISKYIDKDMLLMELKEITKMFEEARGGVCYTRMEPGAEE